MDGTVYKAGKRFYSDVILTDDQGNHYPYSVSAEKKKDVPDRVAMSNQAALAAAITVDIEDAQGVGEHWTFGAGGMVPLSQRKEVVENANV